MLLGEATVWPKPSVWPSSSCPSSLRLAFKPLRAYIVAYKSLKVNAIVLINVVVAVLLEKMAPWHRAAASFEPYGTGG